MMSGENEEDVVVLGQDGFEQKFARHDGDELDDQIQKLSRWLKEQQPKLRKARKQMVLKLEEQQPKLQNAKQRILLRIDSIKSNGKDGDDLDYEVVEATDAPDDDESVQIMSKEEGKALAKKVGAAVVGGALIVTGIPLIPLPGPGDWMVVGGFAVLATEFEGPRKVLDGARDKLVEILDGQQQNDEGKDAEDNKEESDDDTEESEHDDTEKEKDHVEDAKREIKKHAERFGRKVVLPMLNQVCTERQSDTDDDELEEVIVVVSDDCKDGVSEDGMDKEASSDLGDDKDASSDDDLVVEPAGKDAALGGDKEEASDDSVVVTTTEEEAALQTDTADSDITSNDDLLLEPSGEVGEDSNAKNDGETGHDDEIDTSSTDGLGSTTENDTDSNDSASESLNTGEDWDLCSKGSKNSDATEQSNNLSAVVNSDVKEIE